MTRIKPEPADEGDYELFSSLRKHAPPEGCFIGDGLKVVRRMLASGVRVERLLLTPQWYESLKGLVEARTEPDLKVRLAPRERLSEIVGFLLHQGVMALARIPAPVPIGEIVKSRRAPLIVALDGLSNAENVGGIVRSCAAFGVDAVLVGPGTCSPWMRRAVRASVGGVLRVPVCVTDDLAATLRGLPGVASYAAHIHGEHRRIGEVDFSGPACIVLGGEAQGVSEPVVAACRATVYIPMAGGWDCLNVGAAAAVLLYAASLRR